MSMYEANYYRNPVPYTSSDIGEPIPGWGTTVRVAGPARLGVGAFGAERIDTAIYDLCINRGNKPSSCDGEQQNIVEQLKRLGVDPAVFKKCRATGKTYDMCLRLHRTDGVSDVYSTAKEDPPADEDTEEPIPWWTWVAVPVIAGGALAFAYNRGWLG